MRGDDTFQHMIDGALTRLGLGRDKLPGEGRLSSRDASAAIGAA